LPEQESTFWYFFGVKEADCYATIHHGTAKTVLFVPFLDEAYKLWMTVKTPEELKKEYGVDEVRFVDKLRDYLEEVKPSTIYLFAGLDSDSKREVPEPEPELLKGFKFASNKDP
jgi:Xaa-Pro aminopeptidase